jgi:signal transduction histidine kinase
MFVRPKKIGVLISLAVLLAVGLMLMAFHKFAMQYIIVEFGKRQAYGISEVLDNNLFENYGDYLHKDKKSGEIDEATNSNIKHRIESFFSAIPTVRSYKVEYDEIILAQINTQGQEGVYDLPDSDLSGEMLFINQYLGNNGINIQVAVDVSDEYHDIQNVVKIAFIFAFLLILLANILLWIYFSYIEKAIATQQQEVSDLHARLQDAEKDSKRRSDFLANVTHELRTPLNAIIGFSEIINNEAMGPIGNEKYKEFVGDIYASGTHLLQIINDILDYSKIAAGRIEVRNDEVIDLVRIVKVCIKMIYPKATENSVEIINKIKQDEYRVEGDSQRMKQCILNILSNAVKFTAKGGSVEVTLSASTAQKKAVVLSIKDSGIGMEPQDIAKAMEPFGQLDSRFNRKHKGTGLGLPLTVRLIELMGWKLRIESEPGSGTTVQIIFQRQ